MRIIFCGALLLLLTSLVMSEARTEIPFDEFRELNGLYEPSGLTQLNDGPLLVIEDEATRPFILLTPQYGAPQFRVEVLRPRSLLEPVTAGVDDLEGVSAGPDGFIYAITSHSRKSNGKRDSERERLIRFKVKDKRLFESRVRGDFRKDLKKAFPKLLKTAEKDKFENRGGLNIEGLTFGPDGENLWIGLRAPLIDKKALLIAITNPGDAFERGKEFQFKDEPVKLDLDGGGIRDIVYDCHLDGYLIISQLEGTKKEKNFKLWLWKGEPDTQPRRVLITGVKDLERAEGIAPITVDGRNKIILLSDDGDRSKNKAASYLLVKYAQLKIDKLDQ